jgi:hypothetical protein
MRTQASRIFQKRLIMAQKKEGISTNEEAKKYLENY